MRPLYLITLLLLAFALPRPASAEGLHVGTAAIDITPTVFPQFLRSGTSDTIHDPLHVRAVAFQNGSGRAVITLVDAIGLSREMLDEAKALAAAETGWDPAEMLVAATHSHSTPSAGRDAPGSIAYAEQRLQGIVRAISDAVASLQPASAGFGSAPLEEEVFNRRWFMKPGTMPPNPFGGFDEVKMNPRRQDILEPAAPTDPALCVIDVRTPKGKPLALIANYALHYVGGIPERQASADYFGEFSRLMPFRLGGSNPPENFVALMTNGTSGDINNIDFTGTRPPRAPFEQVRIVAGKAADAAWRATRDLEYRDDLPVAMLQREVTLKYRTVTPDDAERALALVGLSRQEKAELPDKSLQYANSTLKFTEPDRTENVLIQAIRIGEQAVLSLPFEVLVEIGLELKAKSPFPHTFTIELANGSYGYLPTPRQHELGGYETWIGTCRVEKDSSVILTRHLLEMLEELRQVDTP